MALLSYRASPPNRRTFVLAADKLITGRNGVVLWRPVVVVHNGLITAVVGDGQTIPPIPGAELLNLAGCTILPGLIDAHVHTALDATSSALLATSESIVADVMASSCIALVRAGVTTVRDLGAPHFWDVSARRGLAADRSRAPRLLLATRPITVRDGHCSFMGGSCDSVSSARAVVERNVDAGADLVKIMLSGGFTSGSTPPWEAQIPIAHARAAVETAHGLGVTVAAHAHSAAAVRMGLEIDVDTLEHCSWVTREGLALDDELTELLAARAVTVCPTVNHRARFATGRLPWDVRRAHLTSMRSRNVRLIAGTDAGIPHNPHGYLPAAVGVLADIGMSPIEVIEAATGAAADALGLSRTTGRVEVGLAADLLVVRGDPTANLGNLEKTVVVMSDGKIAFRESTDVP